MHTEWVTTVNCSVLCSIYLLLHNYSVGAMGDKLRAAESKGGRIQLTSDFNDKSKRYIYLLMSSIASYFQKCVRPPDNINVRYLRL
jgi:hypothetical protein